MPKRTYHITPESGGWAVKAEGEERASNTYPNKMAAVSAARKMLIKEGPGSVSVHRRDGRLESFEVSHSPDAFSYESDAELIKYANNIIDAEQLLRELSAKTGESREEIIRKALALYKVATEAVEQDKAVGIASDPSQLEAEFVGF